MSVGGRRGLCYAEESAGVGALVFNAEGMEAGMSGPVRIGTVSTRVG